MVPAADLHVTTVLCVEVMLILKSVNEIYLRKELGKSFLASLIQYPWSLGEEEREHGGA